MKRFISIITVMVMGIMLVVPASATMNDAELGMTPLENEENVMQTEAETVYNEGEAYVKMKALTESELMEIGYTAEEVEEIKAFNMEEALLERAALPDDTLRAYGYTDEQIKILREYDGAPLTLDNPVLLATSDCDGTYDIGNASTSSIGFTYTWSWNIVPLNKMTDKVVVAWEGVKASNNEFMDLTPSTNTMYLHFYEMTTGKRAMSKDSSVNGVHVSNQNYTSYSFKMAKEDNKYWAKEGVAYITLYPDNDYAGSDTRINYIDLGAGYGHQQVEMDYSFSVSTSLSVSFTPVVVVNKIDNASVYGRVYANGNIKNYGPEK